MTIQGLIVMAIAALAAGFLAWRLIAPFVRGPASSGCHGCSTQCELKTAAKGTPCDESTAPAPLYVVRSSMTGSSRETVVRSAERRLVPRRTS